MAALELWEVPKAKEINMIAGWRQWADAGSISSGLPDYLVKLLKAKQIGKINSQGYYLFQIPGTHDLVRPMVKFNDGFPESLEAPVNELYYVGDEDRGLVVFIGNEPHLNIEDYVNTLISVMRTLKVKRIVGLGGVYGEMPYDKERSVSCTYSLPGLKKELERLSVNFSDYHGGASLGSYLCKRAGENGFEYVGLYGFVPLYDFTGNMSTGSTVRIENDYMAWYGIMQRVKYMFNLNIDLNDLENRSKKLMHVLDEKVHEIEKSNPQLEITSYLERLSEQFAEMRFNPLEDIWEEELKRLFDKFEEDDKNTE